jgi:hypothetical protein
VGALLTLPPKVLQRVVHFSHPLNKCSPALFTHTHPRSIITLFTVFVLLASYDIPALNFLDSYLQHLDIPHSNVIGKGSLKKALQLLGSVQISLGVSAAT